MRLKANDNQMPGLALRAAAIRSSLTQARKDTDGIRPGFHFVDHRLAEPGIGEGPGAEGQEEDNPESKFTKNRKEKLRKQFIHLL